MDADDVAERERLARQVAFMQENPQVTLIGSQARLIDSKGVAVSARFGSRPQTELGLKWSLLFGNPFIHSSVMFRKNAVWQDLRGYDEAYVFTEDFELWSRVSRLYSTYNLPEVLLAYREHSASIQGAKLHSDKPSLVTPAKWQNYQLNAQVIRQNVTWILNNDLLADLWPETWLRYRHFGCGTNGAAPEDVLHLLRILYSTFAQQYPHATCNEEIKKQLAQVLLSLAYKAQHKPTTLLQSLSWAIDTDIIGCLSYIEAYLSRRL
jgi:hypothetical protein